jgi:hypothetical protein
MTPDYHPGPTCPGIWQHYRCDDQFYWETIAVEVPRGYSNGCWYGPIAPLPPDPPSPTPAGYRVPDELAERDSILAEFGYCRGNKQLRTLGLRAKIAIEQESKLLVENERLRGLLRGAKRIITKSDRDIKLQWGPTPGVPDGYGYYWEGDYVGSFDAALEAAGKEKPCQP